MGKRLGQHFLKNRSALKKIVEALDLRAGDPVKSRGDNGASVVIEIGAGHGELTEVLRQATSDKRQDIKIVAVEKDKQLAQELAQNLQWPIFNFQKNAPREIYNKWRCIIDGDALKILPQLVSGLKIDNCKLKICGNIPYYITGKLLRILSEPELKPSVCVFTLQKEVAERIAAQPPRMNKLAAIVQSWAEPKILFYIPRKDFSPMPEVDSAVIKLELRIMNKELWQMQEKYYKTVKILFAQPRKTILNNLANGKWQVASGKNELEKILKETGINPDDRPQDLGIEEIKRVASSF